MSDAIVISGLTKVYKETRALDGIDLAVPEGSVYGFLGPNGAGKTTTLRILTGLAAPTSGTATVFGRDVVSATNEVRADIGFLPDVPGFYPWMTAEEFLRFSGRLFGINGGVLEQRVAALLDLAGLTGVSTRIGGFSRGMKQRLGVAQALINAPKLLMLDEPTSALDPIGRKEVLDMIGSLAGRTTVFFSTHILSDVERVCDTVAILHKGRVVTQAPIEELKERYGAQKIVLEVTDRADEIAAALAAAEWVASLERTASGAIVLTVSDIAPARTAIPALVVERGVGLKRMDAGEISLEEVFVDLVGGEA
ncbi:MAG: ABC transporter ATP-binding protein [Anaerosomatales bacterium]|nr:ABC transporter ATP-binding protein [Anaerosomatales bacterium]